MALEADFLDGYILRAKFVNEKHWKICATNKRPERILPLLKTMPTIERWEVVKMNGLTKRFKIIQKNICQKLQ